MLISRQVAGTFASRQGCLCLSHHIFEVTQHPGFPLMACFYFNHFYYEEFFLYFSFPPAIRVCFHMTVFVELIIIAFISGL